MFDRDDHRCLAAGVDRPCGGPLTLHWASLDVRPADIGPLLLRTFCTAHWLLTGDWITGSNSTFRATCIHLGWSIPTGVYVVPWAAKVPVAYPDGRWYRLDDWGERHRIDLRTATSARRALGLVRDQR